MYECAQSQSVKQGDLAKSTCVYQKGINGGHTLCITCQMVEDQIGSIQGVLCLWRSFYPSSSSSSLGQAQTLSRFGKSVMMLAHCIQSYGERGYFQWLISKSSAKLFRKLFTFQVKGIRGLRHLFCYVDFKEFEEYRMRTWRQLVCLLSPSKTYGDLLLFWGCVPFGKVFHFIHVVSSLSEISLTIMEFQLI